MPGKLGVSEDLGVVALVGVGLIGGSVGLALKERGLAREVIGVGRERDSLERAVRRGAIDRGTTSLPEGVAHADVVVVCTPVDQVAATVIDASEACPRGALITDVGSVKRRIVEETERHPRAAECFVGSHPIAGSERKGAEHARADLFQDCVCALTPSARARSETLARARSFWTSLGCRILEMDPCEHDEILAFTSHLPHVVASALAAAVPGDWLTLAAGAYRDGTRVAAADPGLWTAIFRENRGPLLKAVAQMQERLDAVKFALMTDDEQAIRRCWELARERRVRYESLQPPRQPASNPNNLTCVIRSSFPKPKS